MRPRRQKSGILMDLRRPRPQTIRIVMDLRRPRRQTNRILMDLRRLEVWEVWRVCFEALMRLEARDLGGFLQLLCNRYMHSAGPGPKLNVLFR